MYSWAPGSRGGTGGRAELTEVVDDAHALAAAGADALAVRFGAANRMGEFAAAMRP
jgi:hypothetical protein